MDMVSYLLGRNSSGGGGTVPTNIILEYTTLPEASSDLLGKTYLYTGETTASYIKGYFYTCVSDGEETPTYSWQKESTITMNVTYADNTIGTFELKGRELI